MGGLKRHRKKRPLEKQPLPKGRRDTDSSVAPAVVAPGKKWLFRVLAVLLVPVLLLGGAEIVLRLAGYGYSPHFFKPLRIGDEDFLVENDKFGLRFFPPELVRLPTPLRMAAHKHPGTCRIFILGESAAMGDPEPAFGAGRFLKVLLEERFPWKEFEVVNVSMTAINSHVVLPIARDCARQQGDLWIIYMGNNEMVGPFGAATVFGAQAPPLSFIRLNLALQRTRLGQLAAQIARKLKGGLAHGPSWGGMQMFTKNRVGPQDPRREKVYENLQQNLASILKTGQKSGAGIVLSTVAVNLKDCPPFASDDNTNGSAATRAQIEQLSTEATLAAAQGNLQTAVGIYEQAAGLEPESARLQFDWATCLLNHTNLTEARKHFQFACSLDALPFRADLRINEIIQRTGSQRAGERLVLCDAAEALATNSTAGVCGQESFYEHVHLNFDGNYRLAKLWAEAAVRLLPGLSEKGRQQSAGGARAVSDDWASQELCEPRLGLTDWNRDSVLEEVVRRMQTPPLSEQSNNPRRLQRLSEWRAALHRNMNASAAVQARQVYSEALKRSPQDYRLHENFGDFLFATRDYAAATAQWEQVRELIPQDHVAFFELGRLAALQTNWARAVSELQHALAMRPSFSAAWFELGKIHAARGSYSEALTAYDQALHYQPQDFQAWFYSGLVYSKLQKRAEAIERYRQAARLNPGFWEAHFELGGQLGLAGEFAEAKTELETAVRLNPDFVMSHLNLGLALLKLREFDAAEQQFQETLRLEPGNKLAPACLAQLEREKKQVKPQLNTDGHR
jgi:tetratricopeptide (TPR) repeat protein